MFGTSIDNLGHSRERPRHHLHLCADDWVEVRSREEILATLDEHGCLEGMPFMPEMLQHCGKRLRVFKSAHKTCDTITYRGARRVEGAVHLESVRCDGGAHGGCQAECLVFWKDAWLKPVSSPDAAPAAQGRGCSERQLMAATRAAPDASNPQEPRYACQTTALLKASRKLSPWDLRQYVHDYRTRNVDLFTLLRGAVYRTSAFAIRRSERLGASLGMGTGLSEALIGMYDGVQRMLPQGVRYPRRTGTIPKGQKTPAEQLPASLQPGSWVRVKSYEAILATLDTDNKNRGLYFDAEHVPYCNRVMRVRSLVRQILEENTGKMLHFKTPAIILEGAYCLGVFSDRRMFCPRAIYPYWRAIWLTPLELEKSESLREAEIQA